MLATGGQFRRNNSHEAQTQQSGVTKINRVTHALVNQEQTSTRLDQRNPNSHQDLLLPQEEQKQTSFRTLDFATKERLES